MATMSIEQAVRVAAGHYDAGRLTEAESIYRQILAQQPQNAEALRMLGLVAFRVGRGKDALELVGKAVAANPSAADYHSNLGVILASLKRFDESIAAFREALRLAPNDPQATTNLANVLQEKGEFDEAIVLYREALRNRSDIPQTHYNLAKALQEKGMLEEAIGEYRAAISLNPRYAEAFNSLGTALKQKGQLPEAITAYQQALTLRSNSPEVYYNLGKAMRAAGNADQEIAAYQQAIAQRPQYPDAYNNLGNALEEQGRADEAIAAFRAALSAQSDFPEAYNNLGNVLLQTGKPDEAIECYRKALALRPDYAEAHNNLGNAQKETARLEEALSSYRRGAELSSEPRMAGNVLCLMHYLPRFGPREIFEAHAEWNRRYARPLAGSMGPHANDRSRERTSASSVESGSSKSVEPRLRIGYVSADFREHPVGRFMQPLMANHDHERFEIFCYADLHFEDSITANLKRGADVWRNAAALSDEQLARLVRDDRIDILVDLTMHLQGSRLLAFARKPAPVQVTYLAYCSTTGLDAIDYRFSDPYLDQGKFDWEGEAPAEPGLADAERRGSAGASPSPATTPLASSWRPDESYYSEKTFRLPRTYWCYPEPANSPEVGPLPGRQNGYVTFGCMNNYSKVSPEAFDLWLRVLRAVPDSRLVLHSHPGSHRQLAWDRMKSAGLDPQRLQFESFAPLGKYLQTYHKIDVALDPYPYGGGTTSCDALWMGVPLVSRRGPTAVSRGGLSILSNLGLGELVADDGDAYVRIASGLAGDLPRLEGLRASLRQRLKNSPLMDAPQFARDVEAAYRTMWGAWCDSAKP
jgi:protein O-GlcNAc transferase